ncbi:hypothetical protein [Herbaspirillum autotrophicum]|uniref:hypothetical protein n=1 Tax=Herbaspirillum autotrophicum TaxID=180195 RepID=UPI000B1960A5|nr:hypothetical protein [Herbaspirillum autotrophicum]
MNTPVIQIAGSSESQRKNATEAVKLAFNAAAEHFGVVELARRICTPNDAQVLKQAA